MIVKDEENTLPHCLASVQGVVDEIVIVDTGSSDRTLEVAREHGASVHSFSWCDDFAAARNESLRHAQAEWVLVLDADEVLVPEFIPILNQAIAIDHVLALTLWRQEMGANLPPSLLTRVFRNRPDIRFSRPYHELIDDRVAAILSLAPQWRVAELPGIAILHTGYQAAAIAQRHKADRARSTMERYLTDHPDDAYICSKLGALYGECGEVQRGLDLLHQGVRSPQAEPAVLYELHYHLGSTYRQVQRLEEAKQHYTLALEQPVSARMKLGAYNNLGDLLQQQGDLSQAQSLFKAMIEIDPTFAVGHFNLGVTLKAMGNLPAAIAHYQQAIQLNSAYAEAHQNLGVALLKVGKIPDSLAAFQRAIALHEQQGSPEAERLRQALQGMGLWGT